MMNKSRRLGNRKIVHYGLILLNHRLCVVDLKNPIYHQECGVRIIGGTGVWYQGQNSCGNGTRACIHQSVGKSTHLKIRGQAFVEIGVTRQYELSGFAEP